MSILDEDFLDWVEDYINNWLEKNYDEEDFFPIIPESNLDNADK